MCKRIDPYREAYGRNRRRGAEPRQQPIVAAARDKGLSAVPCRMHLELEPGVIVDPAAERGGEANFSDIEAACGHEADPAFEQIDRSSNLQLRVGGEATQLRERVVRFAGDGQKTL